LQITDAITGCRQYVVVDLSEDIALRKDARTSNLTDGGTQCGLYLYDDTSETLTCDINVDGLLGNVT